MPTFVIGLLLLVAAIGLVIHQILAARKTKQETADPARAKTRLKSWKKIAAESVFPIVEILFGGTMVFVDLFGGDFNGMSLYGGLPFVVLGALMLHQQQKVRKANAKYQGTRAVWEQAENRQTTTQDPPQQTGAPASTIRCPRCGAQVRAEAKICNHCGNIFLDFSDKEGK